MAELSPGVAVGMAVLRPVLRGAAEDAEEQRHAKRDRAAHGVRAAAGAGQIFSGCSGRGTISASCNGRRRCGPVQVTRSSALAARSSSSLEA